VKIFLLAGGFLLEGAFGFFIFLAHRRVDNLITKLEKAP
jgi:hypothetical protein